jgi:hypothetical protein
MLMLACNRREQYGRTLAEESMTWLRAGILPHSHHASAAISGEAISLFSRALLYEIGLEAHVKAFVISSVKRTVRDQARIFYKKHVLEGTEPIYKNDEVTAIVKHARALHAKHIKPEVILHYLIYKIEHAHGGVKSVSRHIVSSPLLEVFDIAYYSKKTNHYYMSKLEGQHLLKALRKRVPAPIRAIGHDRAFDFALPKEQEFADNDCFHLEVRVPVFDKIEEYFLKSIDRTIKA